MLTDEQFFDANEQAWDKGHLARYIKVELYLYEIVRIINNKKL